MKIDRLMGILTVLLRESKTTMPELAERFEVSRRTIQRDIDALAIAGIPIVSVRGGSGGVSIMEGYKINHSVLTAAELESLAAALKGLDSVSKQPEAERLLSKLAPNNAASLPDSIVIDLSSHYKNSLSEKIALFRQAIAEKRAVVFDYYYEKGQSRRVIEPYCVEYRWTAWYVFGWCRSRNDFRRFKLNRLWSPAITDEFFKTKQVPKEKAEADDAFPEQHTAHILFDKSVRFRLIEDYGPDCYEETDSGLLLSLSYTNEGFFTSWVLSFGENAEVLSPPEMQSQIAQIVKNMAEKYRT